jgi:hypothetical protein
MTPPTRPKAPAPSKAAPAPTAKGRARRARAGGRPRKAALPRVPWDEVDRLLVFGESVPCADGESQTTRYPSYRDLGERYGCANSLISAYSTKHNCLRRRAENALRTKVQADQKVVELRATAIAFARDDEVRIIDAYLAGFEKALAEGRVRLDDPSAFNTMVRLKSFLLGGADSRQEVTATLSLEALQARHRQMLRGAEASAAEQGLVDGHRRPLLAEGHEVAGPGDGADEGGGWAVTSGERAEGDEGGGDATGRPSRGPPAACAKTEHGQTERSVFGPRPPARRRPRRGRRRKQPPAAPARAVVGLAAARPGPHGLWAPPSQGGRRSATAAPGRGPAPRGAPLGRRGGTERSAARRAPP